MDDIITQLKELYDKKERECIELKNCSKCPLSITVKEFWCNYDYEEITICDALDMIAGKYNIT